ncbi:DNA polymerase/3'-5' exonuclease PolX [Alkalicoccus luteus]|uniref:DNA-directed DNA polymerase n=1 Tax=Alkalicoccus luteus TaxID=1237094 RepID=A0A969TSL4_9BACI|nr:DNA polymerase/3'-5' exonuclease PolX [Alkalicoccus luteus]NJP36698.1 DNA polymerase/3'-5' exonuclease PolX [Alkalicoccus luteus]
MNKKDIIKTLETIAVYLEVEGANAFRVSAYRKAAGALERDERSMEELDDPAALSGIGKGTAGIINDLRETGTTELLEELRESIPEGLIPLLKLQGLGGKKIGRLYRELGVTNAAELKEACEAGRVEELSGFGKKSQEKILAAVEDMGKRPERLPVAGVMNAVHDLHARLQAADAVTRFELAGSFRRGRETVKDLDFIISTDKPEAVKELLLGLGNIHAVIGSGDTKISVELSYDDTIVPADFRLVEDGAFATTLHHFTGSKDHNVLMRQLAKERGEKISEYGVEDADGNVKQFDTEQAFFAHFDLPFVPPEQREGRDELEQSFDDLVALEDVKGDLHMHTTWSDGAQSIQEMAEACIAKGYSYMAITDHSKFLRVANGLNEERLARQHEEIRATDADIQIFTGTEMDILPDGTLDFEDAIIESVDMVIASIHSSFQQSEEEIMKRLEAACRNPYVTMIAHPTGRLIGKREGYKVDMQRLIELAAETATVLEVNANPSRLDLSAEHLRMLLDSDVRIAINTDAHHFDMLEDMESGVKTARRAGIPAERIINTWSADDLKAFLQTFCTQS